MLTKMHYHCMEKIRERVDKVPGWEISAYSLSLLFDFYWLAGSLTNIQINFHACFGADEFLYQHKWVVAVTGIHELILYL